MTKIKHNEYIVFQPDQVLTNDNLNQLFNYLDQQNRWTRNKLLGMGIVCGLDLVVEFNPNSTTAINSIEIDKGCGITSEGYLILEKENKTYNYAIPYSPLVVPTDIPFNCPNLPFYQPTYTDGSNIFKLITCDQYNLIITNPRQSFTTQPCQDSNTTTTTTSSTTTGTAATPPQPFPLSSPPTGIDLSQYVVVLFLEASENSLSSCSMQDCNNTGDQMVFNLVPLLVPQSLITDCSGNIKVIENRKVSPPEIKLRRYNVPYKELTDTQNILEAFLAILYPTPTNLFNQITDAYKFCYAEYFSILSLTTADNPIPNLQATIATITAQLPNYPFALEYVYDYLNDLILAYNEFLDASAFINTQCCPNVCCFPLHLVLGAANQSTDYLNKDPWRQYFIYSPLFDGGEAPLDQLHFYFDRMSLLTKTFDFSIFENIKAETAPVIGITPSQYEKFPLSERAIPYYYTAVNTLIPKDSLYRYWNYEKTISGNETTNLSYNAKKYSTDDAVYKPLLYDIEQYNFFRIEGHIGKDYANVLKVLLADRLNYNLPFDVVAISSSLLTNYTGTLPVCNILDIETDYALLVCDFLCSLILCIIELLLTNTDTGGDRAELLKVQPTIDTTTATSSLKTYVTNFKIGTSTYKTGDFITAINPPAGTIGATYANSIQNGTYTNPVAVDANISSNLVYYHTYNLLNSTDTLFSDLLNNKVQGLSQSTFTSDYATYTNNITALKNVASDTTNTTITTLLDKILEDCCCSSLICIYEEFLVLIAEYLLRLKNYEAQLSFLNYYKNHPGLEHKAGVPKGGTFVIVYNETSDANALAQQTTFNRTTDLLNYIPLLPTENIASIAAGVVIADFYIPYLCCSDCPPVAYIVEPAASIPSISVAPATPNSIVYCSADPTTTGYLITTSPTGGTITGPGTSVVNGYFFPNTGLTAGTYTITYTVGQQTATAYVEIVDPPKAEFDYDINFDDSVTNYRNTSTGKLSPPPSQGSDSKTDPTVALYADVEIQFINNSINATTYLWNFLITTEKAIFVNADLTAANKTVLASEPNPKCIYSIPVALVKSVLSKTPKPEIKVELTAKNGVCQNNSISEVLKSNTSSDKTTNYLSLNSAVFQPNDNLQYTVQTSSTTGTVSGQGISKSSTGTYQFSPLNLAAGTYPLTYTDTNGVSSTFNVTVQDPPQVSFTSAVSPVQATQPNQVTVQFNNTTQNGATYLWNFGDGQTSTETSPSHVYALSFVESKQGIIPVTLTANNGVYPGVTITTNVVTEVHVSLPNTVYCNSDSSTSVAPATNVSGGIFSIDGVAVAQSTNYKFSPLNMSIGTHTLTYTYNNLSATFDFTVNGLPQPAFQNQPQVSSSDGLSVTFINKSPAQSAPFTWDFGDNTKDVITTNATDSPVHDYPKKKLKALYTAQQKALAKGAAGINSKVVTVTVTLSCTNNCGKNSVSIDLPLDISTFF